MKYMRIKDEIICAEWDGEALRWRRDEQLSEDDYDVLIHVGGTFLPLDSSLSALRNGRIGVPSACKWPDIRAYTTQVHIMPHCPMAERFRPQRYILSSVFYTLCSHVLTCYTT